MRSIDSSPIACQCNLECFGCGVVGRRLEKGGDDVWEEAEKKVEGGGGWKGGCRQIGQPPFALV